MNAPPMGTREIERVDIVVRRGKGLKNIKVNNSSIDALFNNAPIETINRKMLVDGQPNFKQQKELQESKARTLAALEAMGLIKLLRMKADEPAKADKKKQKRIKKGLVSIKRNEIDSVEELKAAGILLNEPFIALKDKPEEHVELDEEFLKFTDESNKNLDFFDFINKLSTEPQPIIEEHNMSLADELKAIPNSTKKVEAPVAEEEVLSEDERVRAALLEALLVIGGPDTVRINAWKKQHGNVYIIPFYRETIYVFTHLTVS